MAHWCKQEIGTLSSLQLHPWLGHLVGREEGRLNYSHPRSQSELNVHGMCCSGENKKPSLQGAGALLSKVCGSSRRLGAQMLAKDGASSLRGPGAENVPCPFLLTGQQSGTVLRWTLKDRILWCRSRVSSDQAHTRSMCACSNL